MNTYLQKLWFVLFLAIQAVSIAQENFEYQSILIDSTLKANADAVVRLQDVVIQVNSVTSVVVKTKEIVTVLNRKGNRFSELIEYYSGGVKVKSIKATVYGALGNEIKKIKRKDFEDYSAVDNGTLAGDSRVLYYDYTPTSYPYTIVYESEVESKSTAFIQPWFPVVGYGVSVQRSSYQLLNPQKIGLRHKEVNFEGYQIKSQKGNQELSFVLTNTPALESESKGPNFRAIVPQALVALDEFSLVGVKGVATDWKSFGQWQYDKLVTGRGTLSEETKQKISDLVKDATTNREKAKRIYKYVQDKTRYISVQLGIGGWMPMQATDVDRLGYGDCKALTNYTKALLDSQQIPAYYTIVYGDRNIRSIDSEFAALQGNHVILNVPDGDNDIWLECTSQTLPFDFIGDFTDNRNVLVVKPDGGEIKKTKKYTPEENILIATANIDLKQDKSFTAQISLESTGLQYDWRYGTQDESVKDQKTAYKKEWGYINDLSIQEIKLDDNKDEIIFTEELKVSSGSYATKAGTRLLFAPNVFNRIENQLPKYEDRKMPLVIRRGYEDMDVYTINLPDGYVLNKLPVKKEIQTIFGIYSWELEKTSESQLKFSRHLKIIDGTYPKEKYEAYRQFMFDIRNADKSKVVLKQQ